MGGDSAAAAAAARRAVRLVVAPLDFFVLLSNQPHFFAQRHVLFPRLLHRQSLLCAVLWFCRFPSRLSVSRLQSSCCIVRLEQPLSSISSSPL